MKNGHEKPEDFYIDANYEIYLTWLYHEVGEERAIDYLKEKYQQAKLTEDKKNLDFYNDLIIYLLKQKQC